MTVANDFGDECPATIWRAKIERLAFELSRKSKNGSKYDFWQLRSSKRNKWYNRARSMLMEGKNNGTTAKISDI